MSEQPHLTKIACTPRTLKEIAEHFRIADLHWLECVEVQFEDGDIITMLLGELCCQYGRRPLSLQKAFHQVLETFDVPDIMWQMVKELQ